LVGVEKDAGIFYGKSIVCMQHNWKKRQDPFMRIGICLQVCENIGGSAPYLESKGLSPGFLTERRARPFFIT